MQMRESDVGENPPNSGTVYLSGESQTPPAYPDRADENEAGIRAQWGELPMNHPEGSHVAYTAPPSARFGTPVAERCHRRAHSTTGPQCRSGSTWIRVVSEDKALIASPASTAGGPVDQLEDRYLGMVEAVGSNPTRSTFPRSIPAYCML